MGLSKKARTVLAELGADTKMGDIKKRAKEIKKDHALALELWASGQYVPRLLAVLVFDKNELTQSIINDIVTDMLGHDQKERDQLADWLMANQLMRAKKLTVLLESWQANPSPILRRLFWYHQARLRWTGQKPPPNTKELLDAIEKKLPTEDPIVQWAMNDCAGWIGVHESRFRTRCVKLGKRVGLYRDEQVAKNCTPAYLPEFIRIEVAKREVAYDA